MKSFLIITLLLLTASSSLVNALKPILIVPGLIGSALEVKLENAYSPSWHCRSNSDWYQMWIDIMQVSVQWPCFNYNMKLEYDVKTNKYTSRKGVTFRPKDYGGTAGVEYLNFMMPGGFKDFVDFFTINSTYVRNKTISAAPYDFRVTPRTNTKWMKDTKALVEELYNTNKNTKVVLVSQSMGCPCVLYFLNQQTQEWKDQYIDSWFSAGGVFAGTVQIGGSLIMGEDMGVPKILDKQLVREIFRTWEIFYWLQPNKNYWSQEEVIFQIGGKNYTAHSVEEMYKDLGIENGYQKWKKAQEINHELVAPGVHFIHAYSLSVPTQASYNFKSGDDRNPTQVWGDGDGTVNQRSQESTLKWKNEQTQKVVEKIYHGIPHPAMPAHKPFQQMVYNHVFDIEDEMIVE